VWWLFGLLAPVLAGAVYQALGTRLDRQRFPAPGKLVGGLHVQCSGEGPPVVLEAGIAASSVGWVPVQRALSEFARVCSYDRRGYAWSPCSAQPCTPDRFLSDLDTVVRFAGTPTILVGHSFGGYLVQLYAARHPERVAGLVLVDPPLLSEWRNPSAEKLKTLETGVSLSRRGAWLARVGFVRLALTLLTGGARGLSKLFGQAGGKAGSALVQRLIGEVRKLPPELWPVVQSHWSRPQGFAAMAEHLVCLPEIAGAVGAAPAVPTVVISGSHLTEAEIAEHRQFGRHVVAEGSGHWVHLDRPDLIAGAVQSLIYG
jgi:pimeloyl-ACP methyl ester carboxylesterase